MFDPKNFDKIKNIIILHHDDMDGYISARQLVCEFSNYSNITNIETHECTYGSKDNVDIAERVIADIVERYLGLLDNNLHDEYESRKCAGINTAIFIVDFSVKPHAMEKLLYFFGFQNVYWIDHHESAIIGYLKTFEEMYIPRTMIKGLRVCNNLCASELTWLFLNKAFNGEKEDQIGAEHINYNGKSYNIDIKESRDELLSLIPEPIRAVGDWDVWRHVEYDDGDPRKNDGLYINNYFSTISVNNLAEDYDDECFDAFDYSSYDEDNYAAYMDALNDGAILQKYKNANYKKIFNKNNFECIINDEKFNTIHAIAVNTTEHTSLLFNSVKDKYEVGIVYNFNGDKTRFSFYRLNENKDKVINCATIASTFGGGGHAGAAGCIAAQANEVILPKI